MKSLTLLRHAKSSWDDHGLSDFDRPLAKRGLRDAPVMGARLAASGLAPDLVISSPAKRAKQTADLVIAHFDPGGFEYRHDPRLYLASPGDLLEIVRSIDESFQSAIVVGHNPGLTQLGNLLLPSLSLLNLPTCGVIAISCAIDVWHEIDPSVCSLGFYDYPKNPDARSAPT